MAEVQMVGAAASPASLHLNALSSLEDNGPRTSVCGRIRVLDEDAMRIKLQKVKLAQGCCLRPCTANVFRGLFGALAVAAVINQIVTEFTNSDYGKRYAVVANVFDAGVIAVSNVVGACWAYNRNVDKRMRELDHQLIEHYRTKHFLECTQDYFDFRNASNWRRVERAHGRLSQATKEQYLALAEIREKVDAAAIAKEPANDFKMPESIVILEEKDGEGDALIPGQIQGKPGKEVKLVPALDDWIQAVKTNLPKLTREVSGELPTESSIIEINQVLTGKFNKLSTELASASQKPGEYWNLKKRKMSAYIASGVCVLAGAAYAAGWLWSLIQPKEDHATLFLLISKICFIVLFPTAKAFWNAVSEKEKQLEACRTRAPIEIENGQAVIQFIDAVKADEDAIQRHIVDPDDPGRCIRHCSESFRRLPPHIRKHLPDVDVFICKRIETRYPDNHPVKVLFLSLHKESVSQGLNNKADSVFGTESEVSQSRSRPIHGLRPLAIARTGSDQGPVNPLSPRGPESQHSDSPPETPPALKRLESKWEEFENMVGAKIHVLAKGEEIIDRPGDSPRLDTRILESGKRDSHRGGDRDSGRMGTGGNSSTESKRRKLSVILDSAIHGKKKGDSPVIGRKGDSPVMPNVIPEVLTPESTTHGAA